MADNLDRFFASMADPTRRPVIGRLDRLGVLASDLKGKGEPS